MADELTLVKRFHQLASDWDNRPVVVRRGTVKSIVRFMRHQEWEVRHTAAETILLLAKHPENKEPLCREPGFLDELFECYKSAEVNDPKLHDTYSEVFEELRSVLAAAEMPGNDENGPADGASIRTVRNRPTRVKHGASVSRSVTLTVANLTASTHAEMENTLQTTRGIVSYTIDVPDRCVRIFGSTPTAALVTVLTDCGFQVEVASDEAIARGSIGDENGDAADFANKPQPTYKGSTFGRLNFFGDFDWKRTLVLHGIEGNSLQARLEQQKAERARKNQQEKGAMANLLGKLKSWW